MIEKTGAQILIGLLERQRVETVAGVPGGANLPIYDALSQSSIRHVLARHEQGAGFIAQGMARATGIPGVAFATSGPGATNVLTAVADAKLDSVPLVCVTGQVATSLIGTDAFQEVDTYGMSIPITKHNLLVRSAAQLLEAVPEAFRLAASGRPGPVLIDVPRDVQDESLRFEEWPEPGCPETPAPFDLEAAKLAVDMIGDAERPMLYIGGGLIHSGGGLLTRALAERNRIPVVMTLMGLGAFPVDHPLSLGMLGMHGARYTNFALEECDLLIAAGVRFDDRATGKVAEFCPSAKVIHIDIDPSELGKIKTPHVAIAGDVSQVMKLMLPLVPPRADTAWQERIAELKRRYPLHVPSSGGLRSPCGLICKTASLLDDRAIIVTDVGQHQMWVAQAYPFRRRRQLLTSGGLGTMGFGLPAALGAALACPDQTVVCFSGDGSLLMNIQELATAVEEYLDVKVLVMNNNSLGLVHQQQDLFYGKRIFAANYRHAVDFVGIAAGFGMNACDLATHPDPAGALAEALQSPGPYLINAPIDVNEKVYPMVPPGAANRDMIGGEGHV